MTTVRQERTEIGKCGYYALDSLRNSVSIGTLCACQIDGENSTGPVSEKN